MIALAFGGLLREVAPAVARYCKRCASAMHKLVVITQIFVYVPASYRTSIFVCMYRSFQINSIGAVGAAVYTQTFSQPAYLLTPQEGICGKTPKMLCRRRAFGCAAVGAAGRTLKAVLLETAAGQGRSRAAGLSRCTTRRAHAAIFCTSVDFYC